MSYLKGRREYVKYQRGEKLTHKEAILAGCFDCMNKYDEGREACQSILCPLLPFMPYTDFEELRISRSKDAKRAIKDYEENVVASAGRTHYLRYLKGKKLSYRQAALAKCAECTGGHADGRIDCKVSKCPLYQFMPYLNK